MQRSRVAWEQAGESGLSIRESKCRLDMELFLDEYPWWELETPSPVGDPPQNVPACHQKGEERGRMNVLWGPLQ